LWVGPSPTQQTMPHQRWEVGSTCQFSCQLGVNLESAHIASNLLKTRSFFTIQM
jgi:hypothetical protein